MSAPSATGIRQRGPSRNQDPRQLRTIPRTVTRRSRDADTRFGDYVLQLGKILVLPVTLPVRVSYRILTSPSTISIGIKLALFSILLAISAAFTAVTLAGFWYSGRGGSVVEVEGWFIYGSKTSPIPHAYIRLPDPERSFTPGVGYDVDVELELVRPRQLNSEDGGNFMLGVDFYSQANGEVLASVQQPCLPAQPYIPPSIPARIIKAFTSPAIYLIRLPFKLNPTSLLYNPLNLLHASSAITRKRTKSSRETFVLTRPIISSVSNSALMALEGNRGFEGKGIVMRPEGRGKRGLVGAVQVSIGREDGTTRGEVKTTGWVVVKFTPRPTGLRYIFVSHPLIPLLVVPPFAFFISLSSATFSYFIISMIFSRPVKAQSSRTDGKYGSQPEPSEKTLGNAGGLTANASSNQNGEKDHVEARTMHATPATGSLPAERKEKEEIFSGTGSATGSTTSTLTGMSD